ncbi:MAG: hypothetical protein KKD73_12290 [Proteobacteria bacterium]|nr:hypothetical protein [Pseudomonadota bacterium]MBU1639997.1 hypothetical protein [Pseudomonadota bacterium]
MDHGGLATGRSGAEGDGEKGDGGMERIIDGLVDSVEEIKGVYLYDFNKNILLNRMPEIFSEESLLVLAEKMVRNLNLGKSHYPDIAEVSLHFGDSNITAKEMRSDRLLIVMFNPSVNKQKLHMSLELALESLAEVVVEGVWS